MFFQGDNVRSPFLVHPSDHLTPGAEIGVELLFLPLLGTVLLVRTQVLFNKGMAHNIELFLAGQMLFFKRFKAIVVGLRFLFVDAHDGAVAVEPLPAIQGAGPQLLHQHRRRVLSPLLRKHCAFCSFENPGLHS